MRRDLTGSMFGQLNVLAYAGTRKVGRNNYHFWQVRCSCGTEKTVRENHIVHGNTVSCGCYARKACGERFRTHGLRSSRSYNVWKQMIFRCFDLRSKDYKDYGGRGITVDQAWQDVRNFIADMGQAPRGMTLDRIDVNQGYSKSNCRWATTKEQARNTRRNRVITAEGQTLVMTDWAALKGIPVSTICNRIRCGWPADKAVQTPRRSYQLTGDFR
ncbi:hypothetical protein UFOVP313_10 [uncultured Caudovirales phage]|uniref:Uncharacterized protein n=1 Tax=uncultured Caudovirales phage TaxID=2100421 RepID=A0A6J5LUZ8_9CAUD|nr:hypothetical protein UFOVP313_10 [uncultured Caudovirales phage]